MYSPKKSLEVPDDFQFPFEPYKIQEDLMKELYSVLENKNIGIFESPTGTGKSLTLTCSSLRWLLDHQELVKIDLNQKIIELENKLATSTDNSNKKDWIEAQYKDIQVKNEIYDLKKTKVLIEEYENRISRIKEHYMELKKKKFNNSKKTESEILLSEIVDGTEIDEEFLLDDDWKEDNENDDFEDDGNEMEYKDVKIYFCSRTHSQLSQVVREVKKTKYGSQIRCVSLASRQNVCINPAIKNLSSVLINEKCLDLQKKANKSKITLVDDDGRPEKKARTKTSSQKCPFKNQSVINLLHETMLNEILDIEDLVQKGESLKACPYYSGRAAMKDAQIIMLPYQMLLHKKTRQQMGIDLKNSIIIIDEAHNLLDVISSIHSSEINLNHLEVSLNQLNAYKRTYMNRFSVKNLLKINQLIFITKRLIKLCCSDKENMQFRIIKTHELMFEGEFFNININNILNFCEQTRLSQKINGFSQKVKINPRILEKTCIKENQKSETFSLLKKMESQRIKSNFKVEKVEEQCKLNTVQENTDNNFHVIRILLAFLNSLCENSENGRVLIKYNSNDSKLAGLKFMLLNPAGHFEEIIEECRSIVIAGGTMRPTNDLIEQLFKDHITKVSLNVFGHVVPSESVLPIILEKGPTGKKFLFNFANKENKEMMTELGRTLLNISNVTPGGIVCFFGSYEYLEKIYNHFENEGVLKQISNRKHIFRESRQSEQSIEKTLKLYSNAIKNDSKNGAILFSVVGGKLSEGLNFADDLGRCIIVIGLPYPNKNSPELLEKIKYLNSVLGSSSGNEYYENLCIKAVNQCIGRSIRHIRDYASVLLIDERYSNDKIKNKLPEWISCSLFVSKNFGQVQGSLTKFFRQHLLNNK